MALIKREGADAFTPKQGIDKVFEGKDCPYCLNKFDDSDALRRHINRKHTAEPDESIEDELQDEFGDDED